MTFTLDLLTGLTVAAVGFLTGLALAAAVAYALALAKAASDADDALEKHHQTPAAERCPACGAISDAS